MELSVLVLVLVAALLHAIWNALAKVGGDPLLRLALVAGSSSLLAAPFLFIVDGPWEGSYPYLLLSAIIHQAYYALLALAYKDGDLSTVYPIARGIAPVWVALGAWVLAGENLGVSGLVGIVTVGAGILALVRREEWRCCRGLPAAAAFLTALTIAGYSVVDGLGVRISGSVLGYAVHQCFWQGLPVACFVFLRRRKTLGTDLRKHGAKGLMAGALSFVAYAIAIWAMSRAPLGFVAALREVGVVFAALIGTRLLGESGGRRRVLAALAVTGGIVLMRFAT